jgi:hypothetical protein
MAEALIPDIVKLLVSSSQQHSAAMAASASLIDEGWKRLRRVWTRVAVRGIEWEISLSLSHTHTRTHASAD